MADEAYLEEASNPNVTPHKDDFDAVKGMTVPETIKVSEESGMDGLRGITNGFQGTAMTVPERIVLDGGAETSDRAGNSNIAPQLQSDVVNLGSYMGGMVTPPRTLTVDDTTSHFREEKSAGRQGETLASGRKDTKQIGGGRFFQGDTRSDDDVSNYRLQTKIVQLNNRVAWLEKKLEEKQASSFWRTTLTCVLTSVITCWLFKKTLS